MLLLMCTDFGYPPLEIMDDFSDRFQIAILNLVSHPHIIELIEVFDFFNEKYLVTELVPGKAFFVMNNFCQ